MNKVIEITEYPKPRIIIDNDMPNYDNVILFPEKLKRAKEFLAKNGIPEEWANESLERGEKYNFWTSGILQSADTLENTFVFIAKSYAYPDGNHQYTVSTTPKILNGLFKDYSGEPIRIHIKAKAKKDNTWLFKLLEVKTC
jgi:hypothetical protein